jgi:hypothetical protein
MAKLRFGGPEWVNSATMLRAVVRRGSWFGHQLVHVPWTLHWFQWVLMTMELLSPLIFVVAERWRRRMIGGWYLFHALTYAMITIAFWPHLVMLLAFLPLEEYRDRWRDRKRVDQAGVDQAEVDQAGVDQAAGGSEQAGVPPGSRLRFRATQR